jgi:hypothetical protein
MEHKIKIAKEQSNLFKHTGSVVSLSNGDVYMNIPYWLKETDEENVYEYLTTEQLPDDIRKQLKMYSEEDMKFAYEQGARLAFISQSPLALHKGEFPTPQEWFEQFKNK